MAKSKYFHLQFNRERTGESEFEEKLRSMAKENNLTLAETIMALVMAVNNFKVTYNVNLEMNQEPVIRKTPELQDALEVEKADVEESDVEGKSPLDAILNT